jgi:hypothetical protein
VLQTRQMKRAEFGTVGKLRGSETWSANLRTSESVSKKSGFDDVERVRGDLYITSWEAMNE